MPAALAAEERSGRSTRRKPLSLGLDSEPDQSTSCDEEEALRALSRTFATTFPSLKSSDSLHDRHSKPALVGNAEAHGASSEESNEPLASAEDSSSDTSLDTPSLSTGSLSSNEDGFILQEHLAQLYSVATPDLTPNSSSTTLTTLNTNTPTPSQPQLVHEHNFYSEGLQLDHIGRDQEDSPPQTPIPEEDDSRMLSLPLKVCAYALALLPIPSSVFSSRRAPSPPPLPVEHPESPKICALKRFLFL